MCACVCFIENFRVRFCNLESHNWLNCPPNHNQSTLNICNEIVFQQKTKNELCLLIIFSGVCVCVCVFHREF